jgi:tellurium resistance protein TerD
MNLTKMDRGQRINLAKENPGLSKIKIGLSWDVKEGVVADLDAAVVCLNSLEKMSGTMDSKSGINKGLVYYNNLEYGSVKHHGDNRTGEGEGDDEVITLNLNDLPSDVESILSVITIYNASDAEKVVFGRVKNAAVRLYNAENNEALYEFDLTEDASNGTSVEMCRLYKKSGEWRFATLGEIIGSTANGLEDIASKYK